MNGPPKPGFTRVTFDVPLDADGVRDAVAALVCTLDPQNVLRVALGNATLESAPRAAEVAPRAKKATTPKGALSDRAELMLAIVRESTELATDGEALRFFVPSHNTTMRLYGRALPFPGFRPSGAGDVAILKSLERRELIRSERLEYSYSATREGIAAYDDIKKRRDAVPETVVRVDDDYDFVVDP
jgi:hypothetical protein